MRTLRRAIGILGIALVALGFYSLVDLLAAYNDTGAIAFSSVSQFLARHGWDAYIGGGLLQTFDTIPAFFTLTIAGIAIGWWGLKTMPPKPKFRKG